MPMLFCVRDPGRFFSTPILCTALTCVLGLAFAFRVNAESGAAVASGIALEEIVVTAQKRVSTVQETPISISAVSGDDLLARGISSFATLAQATPGVSLKSEGPGQTEIEMRGMTSSGGNSATVGFYLDNIPLTAPASAQNGHVVIDPALYDLNRVETLRGPQGTLYGSGSMGGTVRLITNQPNLIETQTSLQSTPSGTEGGGFNHAANFMVNLPLVRDTLALRLVGTEAYTSGWIDRIVANPFPQVSANGALRGDVEAAPIEKQIPGSNAGQLYSVRVALLWKPTDHLSIAPSFLYQTSTQNGISAYDSPPGAEAHYQPFDIAEPLTDEIRIFSLNVIYSFDSADVTSNTAQWNRRSTQTEDSSEEFNNPNTGASYASNFGLSNPGYYGPIGTGMVYGVEDDPSGQFSEELRAASTGDGKFNWVGGVFFSNYSATWNFNGTSENPYAYMDLGTDERATTTHWFDALSPTRILQHAIFGDVTYDITSQLKANVGLRYYSYDYRFSSVISGWGSSLGATRPSESGLIAQTENGVDPKFNLSYEFDKDLMVYATAAKGFRPGGGNAKYPTTGPYWSAVYSTYGFTGGKWPSTYQPDSVWSYEIGEKARFYDRRLTVNASIYYENWDNIQLEAYPGDWALNINGNHATIYGGEIETRAILGGGFELSVSGGYTHTWLDPGPHWQIQPLNKLPEVAPVSVNVILGYSRELTAQYAFSSRLENSFIGQRYSLAFPYGYSLNGEYIPVAAYDLTNIRAGIQSRDGWGVALFVDNVFNKHAQLESLYQETLPSAAFNRIVTNQPLTGGVDLTYRF
jgi:iron complex outermembrane receptor protein